MVTQDYWTHLSASMIDKVIGNEYQLLEDLGHGAFGCLFLGQSLNTNTYVAVKVLSKAGLDPQQLKLQQLEIDIQSSLKHPYLLALHRVLEDEDYIFMVMELCDQGDLFDFVVRDQEVNKLREEHLVKKAYLQILDGIEYMHSQNIYHRDIKLENVLLRCEEDEDDTDAVTCKVADFGLATRDRYSMEFGCGSTTYLAPEHFDGDDSMVQPDGELSPYDSSASDVWSLGILLLALMFGRNPWQEATTMDPAFAEFKRRPSMVKHQLFPALSGPAFQFVKSVLAIDAAKRPTVSEMKKQFAALDRLYTDEEDEEDEPLTPVDIPAFAKQDNRASYDSAFFSGTGATHVGPSSWSDMVEEEEAKNGPICYHQESHHSHDMMVNHDDDDTMFIHSEEKESWWL
ncbi:hypothetical protein DFQ28_004456 [Apophysomyces sp. BC1034]|nr:hypothetical protein DFQ30_002729 [Apophysomyces sp. BC1015]KAG0182892.1 hypothetical protein DFQ29_001591 [Apophysomyces sp. BC1021]KAG0193564.1 hypothetical protein DFQ28_004456 [Apophysomyces sp. BC1034]